MYLRIILLILLPIFGFSQAPQKINFQSILRNTNGEVVANKAVSLRISILSGSITGNMVYSETHTKTTDASGLISLQIGNGTVISGAFSSILWGNAAYFIKLEADFNGGSNYVLLGTQELMSVPYALYASKTDTTSLNLVNRFNSKVNISDTSNMLLNYRTRLNNKVNISDTTSMLNPYLRKSDSIIADLQNQDKLLQSFSNVTDIDGNKYKTVKIGTQVWMSENLKTSRYRNGNSIPNVIGNMAWQALTTGSWSNFNFDSTKDKIYGKLYNWYTTKGDTLCPIGWHVPSDAEWIILTNYLGGEDIAGGRMKNSGAQFWDSPNLGATNESGFSALPGGYRNYGGRDVDGSFGNIGSTAFFWSSTESNFDKGCYRYLASNNSGVSKFCSYKSYGFSIRCLKDSEIDIDQSLNIKVNIADTSDMLNPYLRKADSIIADLQLQIKQLQSLSNVIDIDGNAYKTVKIGSQIWMSENLKTSHYRNGDSIPTVTDNTAWSVFTTGARCWYNNDSTTYENPYGNLYNWYAVVDNRNICPIGFHIPSNMEWSTLVDYLGGESIAGGKMKATGTIYWDSSNTGATNESGFTALGGGARIYNGSFAGFRGVTHFRSTTEYATTFNWSSILYAHNSTEYRGYLAKNSGAFVRCLKD